MKHGCSIATEKFRHADVVRAIKERLKSKNEPEKFDKIVLTKRSCILLRSGYLFLLISVNPHFRYLVCFKSIPAVSRETVFFINKWEVDVASRKMDIPRFYTHEHCSTIEKGKCFLFYLCNVLARFS